MPQEVLNDNSLNTPITERSCMSIPKDCYQGQMWVHYVLYGIDWSLFKEEGIEFTFKITQQLVVQKKLLCECSRLRLFWLTARVYEFMPVLV